MDTHSSNGRAVVFRGQDTSSAELLRIEQVLSFYGLECVVSDVSSRIAADTALSCVEDRRTLVVFIAHDVLLAVDQAGLVSAIRRSADSSLPVLIFGVTASDDCESLAKWTGGAVDGCVPVDSQEQFSLLKIGNADECTAVLKGVDLPAVCKPACRIRFGSSDAVTSLLHFEGKGTSVDALVRITGLSGDVFLAPQMVQFDSSWVGRADSLPHAFSLLAPVLLFVKRAAGEYAWGVSGRYANLTIDDPWLIEPYGHLSYSSLLREMERHNFHTTIAFVPWNYDRSKPQVTEIFRANPERFSICMHGNNHIHREFGEYENNPLSEQIGNIKQGLARMDRFTQLTEIPADRFMVFPHGSAPEPTLAALKAYNFLGTANSLDVPLGSPFPRDTTFLLRPFTCKYAGILSLSRYSAEAEVNWGDIAIHIFLGNPLLFYGHQQMFARGTDVFNEIADRVNTLQPATKWTSPSQIARQICLKRKRFDGSIEVRMLSSELALQNDSCDDQRVEVEREDGFEGTARVTIDGHETSLNAKRKLSVVVPSGQCRRICLEYTNDLDLATQEIEGNSLHASVLRRLSDYRDLYLTRSRMGRLLTQKYYQNRWDSAQVFLERLWLGAASCVSAVALKGRKS